VGTPPSPFTSGRSRAMLAAMQALDVCFAEALPSPPTDLDAVFERLAACPLSGSASRAAWAGWSCDRLGFAFVGGYQAALARLASGQASDAAWATRLCLAATESGGVRPRDIETRVEIDAAGATVTGEKTFATLASKCEQLLVFSWTGELDAAGHKRLRLVRVPVHAPGVTVVDRPALPFAPEIPHATVRLDGVRVGASDVLEGDGYGRYVKPFRTIEDIHVLAATVGLLIRVGREASCGPRALEDLGALLVSIGGLAEADPASPATHVALAGAFVSFERALAEHEASLMAGDAAVREMWERDRPILRVASKARELRAAAAHRRLAEASVTGAGA
jgi:acyl-CoA dehydrogenase